VLYKRVVDQTWDSDGFLAALPLLDCVADMQIGYRYDTDKDGYADMFIDATADQPELRGMPNCQGRSARCAYISWPRKDRWTGFHLYGSDPAQLYQGR